eukprot:TRINITY_DN11304_c0_g1_i1.p2 TRINITY_DN11304_c0_g1~~TRINITY_DN11304_c0_g1_i1.p2  ORF type:complete len:101 (-),score=56.15 TRINITY_DN11304_c0_g1_i1:11-313(-)
MADVLEELFRSLPNGKNIIATAEGAVLKSNLESEDKAAQIAFSVSKILSVIHSQSSNIFESSQALSLLRLNTSSEEVIVSLLPSAHFVLISLLSNSTPDN